MDILIQSTKEFEQDLKSFSNHDKSLIIDKMNQYFPLIKNDINSLLQTETLTQLPKIQLINNYDSSLYVLKINAQIRLILTIDDDPIFDRIIITLFRVVNSAETLEAYLATAKSLYKEFKLEKEELEV
jgi:hypothetical protein